MVSKTNQRLLLMRSQASIEFELSFSMLTCSTNNLSEKDIELLQTPYKLKYFELKVSLD